MEILAIVAGLAIVAMYGMHVSGNSSVAPSNVTVTTTDQGHQGPPIQALVPASNNPSGPQRLVPTQAIVPHPMVRSPYSGAMPAYRPETNKAYGVPHFSA